MLRYPIGIQSFSEIRKGGYVYVDKTAILYRLVNQYKYVFLSRPRRFGKSLLLSTIECYFKGLHDLFVGLKLDALEHEWQEYPVLRIDLNMGDYTSVEALRRHLSSILSKFERIYGADVTDTTPSERLAGILSRAHAGSGRQAVVLIDEYDKPLLNNIDGEETLRNGLRAELKSFYSVLKSCDEDIKFAMLTGVSRFSHVSIFSDVNNLTDITRNKTYATMCGITHDELWEYCAEGVQEFARQLNVSPDEMVDILSDRYDGYRFHHAAPSVFNPFSLFHALNDSELNAYWSSTGTPSFIVEELKRGKYDLTSLDGNVTVSATMLDAGGFENVASVMYQTGYLTIKSYDSENEVYMLGFPNAEVRKAFLEYLVPLYESSLSTAITSDTAIGLRRALQAGDVDEMMREMQALIASIPCETRDERMLELHYRNMFYLTFSLCGHRVQVERPVLHGRIDVVIETPKRVYLIELKRGDNLEEAVRQFHDRDYRAAYAGDSRATVQIAATINDATHNIARWQVLGTETSDH